MTQPKGFSDVDRSGRSEDLVEYLARAAQLLVKRRQQGYEMLRLQPGASVLDVGCGAGEVCVDLANRVGPQGRVVGVDLSETMIDASRRTVGQAGLAVELRVASAYELPFPAGAFDAVRSERVLQHLDAPERALAEMLRVTRAGGRIVVIDPDHGQIGLALDDPEQARVFEAFRRAVLRAIVNPHSGTRLRGMFVRAGLVEIDLAGTTIEWTQPDFVRMLSLGDRLSSAVDAGDITRDEADRFASALEHRHRTGTFFGNGVGYRVAATKP